MIKKSCYLAILLSILSYVAPVSAQPGTAFTYQGRLQQNGSVVNGTFDLAFELFSDDAGTSSLGTDCANDVVVVEGLFTVPLDFGAGAFRGGDRWLEISARADSGDACDANLGTYTTLAPLQPITRAPQAQYATEAGALTGGINDPDADPTNELNTSLTLNGTVLQLTDLGGTITADLASLQDGTIDADADPTNEFNTALSLDGFNLRLSDGGGTLQTDLTPLSTLLPGDGHSLDSADGSTTDVVFVSTNGNVGIGTTSPIVDLTLDGGSFLQTPAEPKEVGSLNFGFGFPTSLSVSGNYAYIANTDSEDLKIIDVSDPTSPTLTSILDVGHDLGAVYVVGGYAYVGGGAFFDIVDVSNPTSPFIISSLNTGGTADSIFVSGRYVFIEFEGGDVDLKAIDIADPADPRIVGSYRLGVGLRSAYVLGSYVYIVDSHSKDLKILDISDPYNPFLVGTLGQLYLPTSVYVSGRYAYVADNSGDALKLIDISDPFNPSLANSIDFPGDTAAIWVSGNYAYIVGVFCPGVCISVVDVSNPNDLKIAAYSSPLSLYARSIQVVGRYLYVIGSGANSTGEIDIVDISGAEFSSLVANSLEAGNLQIRNDIVVQGQLQVNTGLNVGVGGIFSRGDVGVAGDLKTTGTVEAYKFVGDGSMLTGITDNVDDADSSPTNELQTLGFASPNLSISDGNSVDLSALQDGTGTDDQTLSFVNTTLSIEDGNNVDLASLQDGVIDSDADPNNEIQSLSFTSPDLTISGSNSVNLSALQDGVNDADADPTNERNTSVALNGSTLEVTDAGGTLSADLSPLAAASRTAIDSLPFVINRPGSYYLADSLQAATGDGISIVVSDVTLDLNGFTLAGSGAATGTGIILASGISRITVRNGRVYNWNNFGILATIATSVLIEHIAVEGTLNDGIRGGDDQIIRNCQIIDNLDQGIEVSDNCIVENNKISGNNNTSSESELLVSGNRNIIRSNIITDNRRGLKVDGTNNIISGNLCYGNSTVLSPATDIRSYIVNQEFADGNQIDMLISEIPVLINQPCNARLTGTLYLDGSRFTDDNGINIDSSSVTLDMAGHTLVGVGLHGNTDEEVTTSTLFNFDRLLNPGGNTEGSGVFINGDHYDITVSNGTLANWPEDGVEAERVTSSRFNAINTAYNSRHGLNVESDCVIKNCAARFNGNHGIRFVNGCVIENCRSRGNGMDGFKFNSNNVVTNCYSSFNSGSGFVNTFGGSVIKNCVADFNGRDNPARFSVGFQIYNGTYIADCVAESNDTGGFIAFTGGAKIENCVARFNYNTTDDTGLFEDFGFLVSSDSVIRNCLATNHEASGAVTDATGAGFLIPGTNVVVDQCQSLENTIGFDLTETTTGQPNLVKRCTAGDNITANYLMGSNSAYGPIVTLSAGALSGAGSDHPWANFEY
jgi:hypothetical protein